MTAAAESEALALAVIGALLLAWSLITWNSGGSPRRYYWRWKARLWWCRWLGSEPCFGCGNPAAEFAHPLGLPWCEDCASRGSVRAHGVRPSRSVRSWREELADLAGPGEPKP